jgi:hypothetical protein
VVTPQRFSELKADLDAYQQMIREIETSVFAKMDVSLPQLMCRRDPVMRSALTVSLFDPKNPGESRVTRTVDASDWRTREDVKKAMVEAADAVLQQWARVHVGRMFMEDRDACRFLGEWRPE